jgi:hypothetical protein
VQNARGSITRITPPAIRTSISSNCGIGSSRSQGVASLSAAQPESRFLHLPNPGATHIAQRARLILTNDDARFAALMESRA